MFRSDLQNTGVIKNQSPINKRPKLKWEFKTTDWIFASPVIANNKILVPVTNGQFFALDMNSEKLWEYRANGTLYSTPAVVDNMVYIGTMEGRMICIDIENGQEIWQTATEGKDGVYASPKVVDKTVYYASSDAIIMH
ncbi:MAG: PQQ-binding-like beta-propeller repeat protein [Calditrichia bacterium]